MNEMHESSAQAAVGGWLVTLLALLALLALSGCDRKPADPPQPKSMGMNAPVAAAPGVASSSGTPDPSVPSAAATAAVQAAPAASTARDDPSNRAPDGLTKAQESNAMPMPGQVNNHSTTANDGGKRSASSP